MNWLNGWQKRNRLTAEDNQMDKLTLDSAREQIAAQATEIQGFQAKIADFETQLASVPKLQSDLSAAVADKAALEAEKATLISAAAAAKENFDADLSAAQAQIADLQKKDMNADNRAAERLAGLHGKPLSLSSQTGIELTPEELRKQLDTEKDPNVRFTLHKKLKATEAKEKSQS